MGWGEPVEPWQAKFVLGDIVGCHDFGRGEKLAWEFALKFEGASIAVAFQKFGLRAYVGTRVDEAARLQVRRLGETIYRAMPILEKTVLADLADEQVARGEVNVENHFARLRKQYEHFKDLAGASLIRADAAKPVREVTLGPPLSISVRNPSYALRQQARFETNAALHGFFSMLEHLLLIAFLISGRDATEGALAIFIGAGWNDKFKRVIDLADPQSKHYYDRLVALHDELRNPAAHGEVHSDGTDFSFILPGVGPVASRLIVRKGRQRMYRWHTQGVGDVLEEVTEIGEWLRSGPLAMAVRYGESELPLFFAPDVRALLVGARQDPDEFSEVMEHLQRLIDDSANMDW